MALLEISELHTYYGRAKILEDVTVAVEQGEVVALLGRNGAGKSTTMKSVMGLVEIARGQVRLDGVDIAKLKPYQRCRRGLGYVPEDRRIFIDLTVAENLRVGHRRPCADAERWSLPRIFEIFPNLAEMQGRPAGRMSGGEQQMLTIARTLMGNPRAILLDEPSEGLAPVIIDQMVEAIRRLKSVGVAILLSEQNLYFSQAVADRVSIIEKGRIRFSGTMAELRQDEKIAANYLMV